MIDGAAEANGRRKRCQSHDFRGSRQGARGGDILATPPVEPRASRLFAAVHPAPDLMVQIPSTPPSARYPGRPAGGRIVVIAPTRAACETIEMGVGLSGIRTVLEEQHGEEIRQLAASGRGFGIVAGTGTGKTLAIGPIAEEIVGRPLRVGVVNREREATPETPTWNVVIVTTGIARRWLQDDLIGPEDTLIVDEIHQTSAELELCLALGKRAGCRFIWLSATVDPTFYADYLDSAEVIQSSAFDPEKAARVRVTGTTNPLEFLSERFLRHVVKEKRGVAVFVPTRASTEEIAKKTGDRWPRLFTAYYHGGEPISKLRPFLEGDAPHPYLLSMTAAGQSALNIQGLDTVVIEDARFTTIVEKGKGVLTRLPLGANEILQMAGRVHGRVAGGEVWILSDRLIDFDALEPTEPNFQLAGDPERVAMTCADVGVRADDLDLPVPLDRIAYRRAVRMLETRGLVEDFRLTEYGRQVEVLPVDRPWGELLIQGDEALVPIISTCASVDSLHRMTRSDRYIEAYVVAGSDHLTAYQLYQDALEQCGRLGSVYGLPRHVFDEEALTEWADERGVLVRSIEDAALGIASIYRSMEMTLPAHFPSLNRRMEREWQRLLARVAPFDLVIDEETSWGEHVRVSPTSVCGRWGAVMGALRYFSDRFGRARGSIEGTQLPYELLWEFAESGDVEVVYDPGHRRNPLRARRVKRYQGFEIDSEDRPITDFPDDLADAAREALAGAMATGAAYHRDVVGNRERIRELREIYRRSGGRTREISEQALREHFVERLAGVSSYAEFQEADLKIDPEQWVPSQERQRWMALPDSITLAGDEWPLDYALDDGVPVVRVRIRGKALARVVEEEVPELDRPLRWTVLRGKRESVRADTLEEARALAVAPRVNLRRDGMLEREWEKRGEGGGRPSRRGGGKRGEGRRGRREDPEARRESRGRRRRERGRGRGGRRS